MAGYELIVFDFDGTLADSAAWMLRNLNGVGERFGLRRISDEEAQRLRGLGHREVLRHLGLPLWKLPRIATEMRRRLSADIAEISLFPGTAELLQTLDERGLRLAIVSSNSEDNVRRILGEASAARIDAFECSASLLGKARKLRQVMRRLGVRAEATLCVGDETRDIEAARDVGAASGAVLWGYATREVLERFEPTLTFGTLAEIAVATL